MNSIKEYAPYLIVLTFICGVWFGVLIMCVLAVSKGFPSACTGDCDQGRECDCVPKIGYPTEEAEREDMERMNAGFGAALEITDRIVNGDAK